jgi:hypothetical protein
VRLGSGENWLTAVSVAVVVLTWIMVLGLLAEKVWSG